MRVLLHLRYDPEDNYCADNSADEFTEPVHGLNAEQAEQPAAEHAAHDAQEEVEKQTLACAALQLTCDETGQNAGDDTNDESLHNSVV